MTNMLNYDEIWKKFIRNRALRLRTTEAQASKPVPSPSHAALKDRAERLGISIEAAKVSNSKHLHAYPTSECITGSELTDFVSGEELSEITINHLSQCAPCRALLDLAAPSEDILKVLLEEVRIRVGAHAVNLEPDMPQIFEAALTKR